MTDCNHGHVYEYLTSNIIYANQDYMDEVKASMVLEAEGSRYYQETESPHYLIGCYLSQAARTKAELDVATEYILKLRAEIEERKANYGQTEAEVEAMLQDMYEQDEVQRWKDDQMTQEVAAG